MDARARQKYFGSINPELFASVPVSAEHVLELGCGTGALGAAWKRHNPHGLWSAIEVVPDAAQSAHSVLDAVLCADIETLDDTALDAFLEGRPVPDVLVFGDVLEHLRDPLAVLRRLVDRLAPDGTVVACIPNISHWSVISSLMAGEWTYTDSGLLDRTHLRFFTEGSARAMLAEAGLAVRKVMPRNVPLDIAGQERFLAVIGPALLQLRIDPAEALSHMQTLQYVFVAQRAVCIELVFGQGDARARQKYFGSVDPELFASVPVPARHVLELGCGAGALGAAWKRRNPHGLWSAIEVFPDAAQSAQSILDAVLCADIETLDDTALDAFLEGRPVPDVLVFGDVLEHLRDPLAVLRRLVDRLASGGTVVACIPNIGHWSVISSLMAGEWTYTNNELLDCTHLRFFTEGSARAMLAQAGLAVRKEMPRNVPLDLAGQERFLAVIGPALLQLRIDPAEAHARMQALQYLFVAQKPPLRPLLAVHQCIMAEKLLEPRTGPAIAALATLPDVVLTSNIGNLRLPKLPGQSPGVLVIQRQMCADREAWFASIRAVIAKGWLLVAEWDDHPDLTPAQSKAIWDINTWLAISSVHACQVSTPRLADVFRAHNPTVAVFANALLDLPQLAERSRERVRIVYAALNRKGVAGLVAKALDAAAAADSRVEIVIVHDKDVFASLETPRRTFLQLLPYKDYLDLLATADIAVLPIVGTEPEKYKSPLKYLECASRGAVCVASPTIYADVIRDGETGIIARTAEDWTRFLLRLVADPIERSRLAEAAWRDVRDRHMMSTQVPVRAAWYRDLCENRVALTRALLERHPELA